MITVSNPQHWDLLFVNLFNKNKYQHVRSHALVDFGLTSNYDIKSLNYKTKGWNYNIKSYNYGIKPLWHKKSKLWDKKSKL